MSEFEPFDAFLDRTAKLRATRTLTKRLQGAAEALPVEDHFQKIQDHVLALYDKARCVGSFQAEDGHVVDCLAIESQPGLAKSDQQAILQTVPPPFVSADGEPRNLGDVRDVPPTEPAPSRDPFGNVRACPPGAIPMRRVSVEQISRVGGLRNFFQKAPGGGRHPTQGQGHPQNRVSEAPIPPEQSMGGVVHRYAHASYQLPPGQPPFQGGTSWLNLWNPQPAPGVFSLSQQWYAGFRSGPLQTVEGGWHVYPDLYNGSTQTHLFVYWTADGYQSTGSYNLTNGDFIQTSNAWVLGGPFAVVSTPGGEQHGFQMQWQRDAQTGNWWLYLKAGASATAVGYFPQSQYRGGPLSQGADSVDYGGEVCSQVGSLRTGPMGSGQHALAGWTQAAFHKHIAYLNTQGQLIPAPLVADQQDAPLYTVDLHLSQGAFKTYFYFDGPGN